MFPVFEVPEENDKRPLVPAAPALGVRMLTDPEEEAVPSPGLDFDQPTGGNRGLSS